jgi:hypothetical protein
MTEWRKCPRTTRASARIGCFIQPWLRVVRVFRGPRFRVFGVFRGEILRWMGIGDDLSDRGRWAPAVFPFAIPPFGVERSTLSVERSRAVSIRGEPRKTRNTRELTGSLACQLWLRVFPGPKFRVFGVFRGETLRWISFPFAIPPFDVGRSTFSVQRSRVRARCACGDRAAGSGCHHDC